jgi:protein SCO1/2
VGCSPGKPVASLTRVNRGAIAALFATALVALAVVIVAARGVSESGSSAAQPAAQVQAPASPFQGALLPKGVRAPAFSLRDERGRRVTMSEYRGKPVVVTFLYSHCHDTCPLQAQQIKGALDDLGHDLPALAISVDPPGDRPASVDRFNRQQGVTGRIRWVLGTESQLRPLWNGFHITSQTPQAEHMARLVLVDKRGFQRIGYPASQVTPERLSHDLRVLERE